MPTPYTTLNARVKQKLATEAYWLSIEDELGVIFEGEQAFVYNESGVAVNFKIGDGTKLFSELPYFIAYMSGIVNQKVLSYVDQTANLAIPITFRNNSLLGDLVFLNNSGADVTLKVGVTDGGSEVFEIILPNGPSTISAKYFFQSPVTLFITGLTGVNYSLFIIYNQLDAQPVTPSATGGGLTSAFVFGVPYPFLPLYVGHTEYAWDLTIGKGRVDTPFEGCTIFGYDDLEDLSGFYLRGFSVGDTLGGDIGSAEITIAKTNLPAEGLGMFATNVGATPGNTPGVNDPVARARAVSSQALDYEMVKGVGTNYIGKTQKMGEGTPIGISPLSKSVLFFTGPQTTT